MTIKVTWYYFGFAEYIYHEVKIVPNDMEVKLRQEVLMSCNTQGIIRNCTWEINGVSSANSPTIENWNFTSKNFGRCQIRVGISKTGKLV